MKIQIIDNLSKQSAGGANERLVTEPLKGGDILCIQAVSACNEDGQGDIATISFLRGTTRIGIETLTLASAGYYYLSTPQVFAGTDFRVEVDFTNSSDGDTLRANIFGFISKKK